MIDPKDKVYRFEEFVLDCPSRCLTRSGEPVKLNSKTFELLKTLVENRGRIVSKDELLDSVWPGQFVEENNLTVQMSTLRKVLGVERPLISTVPGKGYGFVANVTPVNGSQDILVENFEVSRIVVEEFLPTAESDQHTELATNRYGNRSTTFGIAAIAILAVIGGTLYFRAVTGAEASFGPYQNSAVRQLTTSGKVGLAALSPDGRSFAYTIDDLGQKSLWVGYVDGGDHIQLRPPDEAVYRSLTFSPDNFHLFYSLQDEKNANASLMKIPVLGGHQEKVLEHVGTFSLSPGGDEIAVVRQSPEDDTKISISIAPLDGSPQRDIAAFDRSERYIASTLSWRKDGTKIAFALIGDEKPFHTEIATLDLATGTVDRIEHKMVREVTRTEWLDDGSGLVLIAVDLDSHSSVPHYQMYQLDYPSGDLQRITNDRSQYGASWHNDAGVSLSSSGSAQTLLAVEHRQLNNVWLAAADDLTQQRQITFGSFGKYDGLWGLDWTPDGRIIYNTSDTESQFIAEMSIDGENQKQLTPSGNVDSSLSVTADGKHIVFHSNRATDFSIWRTDIDGSNAKQLTSGGDAFLATASPDGKWVYFKSYIGESNGWLCRVPIDGGQQECFTDRETSFASFSPDGNYIAAAYRSDKNRFAIFSAADHSLLRQIDIPNNATASVHIRWKPDSKTFTVRDSFSGYWNFPIDGDPYKLVGLPDERLYNFAWSRDGKWFAFVRGQEIRDVILLQRAAN